ncbi:MAG: GntR family transcriptional regulator [Verrucomicrobia bacterium]|nr:GntR family transcriptional regulator [Verrucomicrobiota bacterium]
MSAGLPSIPERAPTKTEQVHGWLREAILTHALRPGEALNLDELARRHGVSPIPVREAVARLTAERLLVIRPHHGAQVAELDENSVHDIFALLEGLESASAPRVIERAGPEDVAALEGLLGTLDAAVAAGDSDAWGRANAAFHLRLAGVAQLPRVEDQLRLAFDHWDRVRRHFFREVNGLRLGEAQREHREMVQAVARGAAGALEHGLRAHNRTARAFYLHALAGKTG